MGFTGWNNGSNGDWELYAFDSASDGGNEKIVWGNEYFHNAIEFIGIR
jgi:hypothetical protein